MSSLSKGIHTDYCSPTNPQILWESHVNQDRERLRSRAKVHFSPSLLLTLNIILPLTIRSQSTFKGEQWKQRSDCSRSLAESQSPIWEENPGFATLNPASTQKDRLLSLTSARTVQP